MTPQPQDEAAARLALGLPVMSSDVEQCWKDDGNVRLPITLKSKVQNDAETDVLEDKTDSDETEETETEETETEE